MVSGKAWTNSTYRIAELGGAQLPGIWTRQHLLEILQETLHHLPLDSVDDQKTAEHMNDIVTNDARPIGGI